MQNLCKIFFFVGGVDLLYYKQFKLHTLIDLHIAGFLFYALPMIVNEVRNGLYTPQMTVCTEKMALCYQLRVD